MQNILSMLFNGMRSRIHLLSASCLPPILSFRPHFHSEQFNQWSIAATLNKSHATRCSLTTTDFHNKLPWLPQKVEERTKHTQKRWWVGVNGTKDCGRGDEKNKVYCNRPEQCTSNRFISQEDIIKKIQNKTSETKFLILRRSWSRERRIGMSLVAVHRETSWVGATWVIAWWRAALTHTRTHRGARTS